MYVNSTDSIPPSPPKKGYNRKLKADDDDEKKCKDYSKFCQKGMFIRWHQTRQKLEPI